MNKFYVFYHINDIYHYHFPYQTIFKFLDSLNGNELFITDKSKVIASEGFILLNIRIIPCKYNNYIPNHDFNYIDSIKYTQLHLENIPVNLKDDKRNDDLVYYLSSLIFDNYINTFHLYSSVADLIFEYKYITYDQFVYYMKKYKNK